MIERNVVDFFDKEYVGFAKYVVENRAIPSVIDGLKPSQRKIAWVANRVFKTGNEKPLKVFQLAGKIASDAYYHHGGGSLEAAIITMTQVFKNSMPIFQGDGQFGSLRSPEAGAPRYIGVKFNQNFRLLYQDFELCTPKYEEGDEIEPTFFLPIIPTVLLNGGSGIAVGHATNILNRNPIKIIDAVKNCINGKKIEEIEPWIFGFKGKFSKDGDKWVAKGKYEVKNTTTVEVTELIPSMTYEKYEVLLDGLETDGKIVSYEDNSSEFPHYTIKFKREVLEELKKTPDKLDSLLKMKETETENYTVLDENGKLKEFEKMTEIIEYFVNARMQFYDKRKQFLLQKLKNEIDDLDARAKFIKAVISGEIEIRGKKKIDINDRLEALQIPKIQGSWEPLLNMQIQVLTEERMLDLLKRLEDKTKEYDIITSTAPKDMWLRDLDTLKSLLVKTGIYT